MRGYFMRLVVADLAEAAALAESLDDQGARAVQDEHVLSLLWPETEADEPEAWEEYVFAELVFWLRAWTGQEPGRAITVLEERAIEVDAALIRRAS
jgi:hypothetical protein